MSSSANTHLFDEDLNPVIEISSNEDLDILVDIIKDSFSESLTSSAAFKSYSPNHEKYADLICKEIREFGGNTIMNMARREGPSYRKIVYGVAKILGANCNSKQDITEIEHAILSKFLEEAWKNMNDQERQDLVKEIKAPGLVMGKTITAATFQLIFKTGGFTSYQLLVSVANGVARKMIGRGLSFAANATLTRTAGILVGPVGLSLTAALAIIEFAGPSKKVIIPSVVYIAMLRQKHSSKQCHNCERIIVNENAKFCDECGAKL